MTFGAAAAFSAEYKKVLSGGKTFSDGGVSLVHEGLHVDQLQIRKQALMIKRRRRDQIRIIRKHHQADSVTRTAFNKFRCTRLHGLHSGGFAQRLLHALGQVQHDHDLQSASLDAVQDEGIDRTEQGDEQENNRRGLQDRGGA